MASTQYLCNIAFILIFQCQNLQYVHGKGYISFTGGQLSFPERGEVGGSPTMNFTFEFFVKPKKLVYEFIGQTYNGRTDGHQIPNPQRVPGEYEGNPIGGFLIFTCYKQDGTVHQTKNFSITTWQYGYHATAPCYFFSLIKFLCSPNYYGKPKCDIYCKPSSTVLSCTKSGRAICKQGFKGQNCTEDADMCASRKDECLNGATCKNIYGGFECKCAPGWKGSRCETDVNECQESPGLCKNGGTCINSPGSFRCQCIKGFSGKTCTRRDLCYFNSTLCKNGGTCHMTEDNYRCQCTSFFYGRGCELDVDECKTPDFCENNGQCKNVFGGYKCTCPPFMLGPRCRYNNDICTSTRLPFCRNGGTCRNSGGTISCDCSPSFTGKSCELYRIETAVYGPIIAGITTVLASLIFLLLLVIIVALINRSKRQ